MWFMLIVSFCTCFYQLFSSQKDSLFLHSQQPFQNSFVVPWKHNTTKMKVTVWTKSFRKVYRHFSHLLLSRWESYWPWFVTGTELLALGLGVSSWLPVGGSHLLWAETGTVGMGGNFWRHWRPSFSNKAFVILNEDNYL